MLLMQCIALPYSVLPISDLTCPNLIATLNSNRNLISQMLHPEAHKRGGYTDMKRVFNMPFFEVIYNLPYPTPPTLIIMMYDNGTCCKMMSRNTVQDVTSGMTQHFAITYSTPQHNVQYIE